MLPNFEVEFVQGEWKKYYKCTSKSFQKQISYWHFRRMCRSFLKGVTALKRQYEKKLMNSIQILFVDEQCEKAVHIVTDLQGTIHGFTLRPYYQFDTDHLWTKNTYHMPICDEWFVFWGGTNEFENYHYLYPHQRYAYDLIRVVDHQTFKNEGIHNEDYFAFGAKVVAPLDGKVLQVIQHIPDQPVGEMNEADFLGNYIILEHAEGEYSLIAHLKQYSTVVKQGDVVKSGELLALCGNSGNSSEAHIHFQVMDCPHIEQANSLRIRFEGGVEPVQGDTV